MARINPGHPCPQTDTQDSGALLPLTASEHFGPWSIWFDPPPIGTRNCDWHYQHEDADPEGPSWMHGHCASRDDCLSEIIHQYEERLL